MPLPQLKSLKQFTRFGKMSSQQTQQPAQTGQSQLQPQHQQQQPASATSQQQRSTNDDLLLPQGQERSEQMEYLQSYEASAPQSEDDVNQATLQREFPDFDSSLIAAIYGDSKSLSATREMLQELSSTT
jgi:phytoene dehydrogenase-like protein